MKSSPQYKAFGYLAVTIVLAGLSAPILKWLVEHGTKLGLSRPDIISYCNIFFVGNTCAGLALLARCGWRPIWSDLRGTSTRTYLALGATIAVAGVLVPTALYLALESTTATNLLLLMRVESVAFVALGVFLFRDRVTSMTWVGLSVIVVGSVALALVQGGGTVGRGNGLALVAGLLYAVGSTLSRFVLRSLSIETLLFLRNLLGAIVFFFIAILLYGPHHFADAFSAELWLVMTVYAVLVVVAGQLAWFRAIRILPVGTVSTWDSLTPVVGIFFAGLLLSEVPEISQWVGAAIIIGGVVVSRWSSGDEQEQTGWIDRSMAGG